MKKGLVIGGSVLSGICIIIALISLFSAIGFEPEDDNILHDTRADGTTYTFEEGDSFVLQVYAIGSVDCDNFSVSVIGPYDETNEHFKPVCDEVFDTNEYTYVGDLSISQSGTYVIDTSGDIVITNANSIGIGGIVSMASCGCCFIGLILLIVGLVTGKPKPQVLMVQQDGSIVQVEGNVVQSTTGQVISQPQQMVQQPNETTVEQYSFEQKNEWK